MDVWSSDGKRLVPMTNGVDKKSLVDWKEEQCQVCSAETVMDYVDGYYHCSQCGCVQDDNNF
jgi:ribosomal protein S27AE